MKRLVTLAVAALAATCFANNYNMSLGSFALEDSSGCDWNISLGAASMMGATNVDKCVFIGNRAGQSSNAATNVVAIGWGAARNLSGTSRHTDVNGQFTADETEDSIALYTEYGGTPRMEYRNGTWHLNGNLSVLGGVTVSNRVTTVAEGTPTGYDFYVDAQYGDDENDGLSAITAKQTLDAALNLVSNNTSTVCVRAGTYSFPTYFKTRIYGSATASTPYTAHCVGLYAPDGAERTIIANDDMNAPAWVSGYTTKMMTFDGFTFRGFTGPASGYGLHISTFCFVYFNNCVFEDTVARVGRFYGSQEAVFDQCIMENCKLRRCTFSARRAQGWGNENGYYYTIVFSMCLMYNCDVEYSAPAVLTDDDWTAAFSIATEWRDSIAKVGKSRGNPKRTWNGQTASFADGRVYNSTITIGEVTGTNGGTTQWYDSILGYVNNSANISSTRTDCFTNTASYVLSILGNDNRPIPQAVRTYPILGCCGYGMSQNIATKNAIMSYVSQTIQDSIPADAAEGVRSALMLTATRLSSYAGQTVPEEPDIGELVEQAELVITTTDGTDEED